MFKKLTLMHHKYTITIILLIFLAKSLSMEEIPGSSSPDYLVGAAKYYVESLNVYNIEESPDTFAAHLKKIIDAIKEKTSEEQLQTFICMIQESVNAENKYLTSEICSELIACYQNHFLKETSKIQQSALEQIEEKVLPLESMLPCACFDEVRNNLFSHYFTQKKQRNKKEEVFRGIQSAMNQSMLVDETALSELLMSFLNNWPQSRNLLLETIAGYSPTTQFNVLSSCIETALEQEKQEQAIELYEMLEIHYKTFLAGTEYAHLFMKEFHNLAKKYPDLPSKKLDKDLMHSGNLTKVIFNPEKYIITQVKSPRKPSHSCQKSAWKNAINWQNPLATVPLSDTAYAFWLRGSLLLAANNNGEINCYDIKSGKWKKTLKYPGKIPLIFSQDKLAVHNETLTGSVVDGTVSILSSSEAPSPLCSLYITKKEGDMSYFLQGNKNGTLILHDLTGKKNNSFEDKHAAQITALLALPHVAYSGSEDRTIKKWNLKEKKCENTIEELEDTVGQFVLLKNNIIALMGPQKLIHCNLSEKPGTILPLFQVSNKEKNNALETITTFNDELLIAGCKNGQLKIFTYGNGFANIRNIDRDVTIPSPVKTLTNFDNEKLLVHYDDNTVMIFSKE